MAQMSRALLGAGRKVLVAMSGGVDSSVAAILLQKQGYTVEGMYMHNWDEVEESGHCPSDSDYESMKRVCKTLGICSHRVNFVKQYWNNVFSETLRLYQNGWTPNPDVMCNEHIKFSSLVDASSKLNVDLIATGHYARLYQDTSGRMHLLKAADENKDQTYFLSHVSPEQLKNIVFPIGDLTKIEVKKIAATHGLREAAERKESTGLCFVGKRNFQTFIAEYIPDSPGVIIDIDRGTVVGQHKGLHFYTVGQRARIGGCQNAYYVVGKDVASKQLLVGNMVDHPAMFCMEFGIQDIKWISDTAQHALKEHVHCKLSVCHGFTGTTTKYSVKSDKPLRAVAPGQVAVFYGEDECFGGAIITEQGKTCLQQNITLIDTSNAII